MGGINLTNKRYTKLHFIKSPPRNIISISNMIDNHRDTMSDELTKQLKDTLNYICLSHYSLNKVSEKDY